MDTDFEGRGKPFRGSVPDVCSIDRVYAACRSAKPSSGQDVEHLYSSTFRRKVGGFICTRRSSTFDSVNSGCAPLMCRQWFESVACSKFTISLYSVLF